jgi:hypothetical protein
MILAEVLGERLIRRLVPTARILILTNQRARGVYRI